MALSYLVHTGDTCKLKFGFPFRTPLERSRSAVRRQASPFPIIGIWNPANN